jgi:N-acetylmuramoyl-L-alanine amidase
MIHRGSLRAVRLIGLAVLGGSSLVADGLWQPVAAEAAHDTVSVLSVRAWSQTTATRVAIETSGEVAWRADFVEATRSPAQAGEAPAAKRGLRLYFDLKNSRLAPAGRLPRLIQIGDARVRQIRLAQNAPSVVRVVLDLDANVTYQTSTLTNPCRLIVEVRDKQAGPAGSPPPAAREPQRPPSTSTTADTRAAPEPVAKPPRQKIAMRRTPVRVEAPPSPPATAAPPPPPIGLHPASPLAAPPPAGPPPARKVEAKAAAQVISPAPSLPASSVAAGPAVAPPPRAAAGTPVGRAPPRRRRGGGGPPTPVELAAPPTPARSNRDGSRTLTRALGLKLTRVVIDPGHGGHDHGTTGPGGVVEKDLVLDVARRLGTLLHERLGAEVIYTRNDDVFIPLEERTAIANQHRADLFLSIHANSSPLRSVAGPEVYYLNFTTSKADLEVAARENAGNGKSIFELSELVQKIALKDKVQESGEFATRMQTSLYKLAGRNSARNTRNRGVKKAPFVVLIGASMPSVLAEIGFVTNPREESMLKRGDYRDKIAAALYDGIASYASSLSQMPLAQRGGQ